MSEKQFTHEDLRNAFNAGYRVAVEDVSYSAELEKRLRSMVRKTCKELNKTNLAMQDRYTYHTARD